MNRAFLVIAGIVLVALLIFLILRNQKDKKAIVRQMKDDYPKSADREDESD